MCVGRGAGRGKGRREVKSEGTQQNISGFLTLLAVAGTWSEGSGVLLLWAWEAWDCARVKGNQLSSINPRSRAQIGVKGLHKTGRKYLIDSEYIWVNKGENVNKNRKPTTRQHHFLRPPCWWSVYTEHTTGPLFEGPKQKEK